MTEIEDLAKRAGIDLPQQGPATSEQMARLREVIREEAAAERAEIEANCHRVPDCPVWCEARDPFHAALGARTHSRTVAHSDRVTVEISADGIVHEDGTETVKAPTVSLFADTEAEELTASQARALADFLSESLKSAALQLEQIDAL